MSIAAHLTLAAAAFTLNSATNLLQPAKAPVRCSSIAAQLAPGWASGTDATTGQTYYYHEQTGVSQWDAPVAQQDYGAQQGHVDQQGYGAQQGFVDQQGYGAHILCHLVPTSGVGARGEYVVRNGEEQVLGRFDMLQQNPYISRMHCLVRVEADGMATVTAIGKVATMVRSPGTAWFKVRKDQTHALTNGQEIALDPKAPENAVFTVYLQQDGNVQAAGVSQQGGSYGQGGWVTAIDHASGGTYFYNEQTGQSQWESPW